jgi:predicted DNA-binding transcriptional regulator YafY
MIIRRTLKTAEVSVQEIAKRFGVSRSTLYRNGVASKNLRAERINAITALRTNDQ